MSRLCRRFFHSRRVQIPPTPCADAATPRAIPLNVAARPRLFPHPVELMVCFSHFTITYKANVCRKSVSPGLFPARILEMGVRGTAKMPPKFLGGICYLIKQRIKRGLYGIQ